MFDHPSESTNYRMLWGHASRGAVGQRVQMGAGWLDLAADDVDLALAPGGRWASARVDDARAE